jgi:hypothetical protein
MSWRIHDEKDPFTMGRNAPCCCVDIRSIFHAVSAYLLDGSVDTGRLYGAANTPHMYIINPEGTLVYMGAIDSIRSANQADIAKADNYVSLALDAVMAGEKIEVT